MTHKAPCATFLITFLCVIFGGADTATACTSFAVFSKSIYYGMNFDFLNPSMKFLISVNGDIATFHLAFERCLGDMRFWVNTAAMNSRGLFAACQELHPLDENPPEKTDSSMYLFELYDTVEYCRSVQEVMDICSQRPLVNMPGISLHNLFADATGDAVVTEAGDSGTAVVETAKNYLVMTNFPNRSLAGKSDFEAEGKGADRYRICHAYFSGQASDFSIDHGLELLAMTCNKDPLYPTACSMVFDPQNKEVYIVLKRNFADIWKLSITDRTIGTWRGFNHTRLLALPCGKEGISVSDLIP